MSDSTPAAPPPAVNPLLPPQALIGFGLALGIAMIALALVLALLVGASVGGWYPRAGVPGELLLGALIGGGSALLAWGLTRFLTALRGIERLLLRTLDMRKLHYHHALMIGLVAAIPEEMLFRGALQATLGTALAALIFGAMHAISRVYFVYATSAGLLLGALVAWRGDLWAATAAHTTLDALLMALLLREWRLHPSNP